MRNGRLALAVFFFGLLAPFSVAMAGTVLSTNKYAWSNNVGYINFENVVVNDDTLSGYAWSANTGWIKFNPSQGGVLNDNQGNLSGSAWGSALGWIDFGNVQINASTGRFSGTATGTLVGTINFDCPTYCDVQTDWVPGSAPTCTSWVYTDFSACTDGTQTRSVITSFPSNCVNGSPTLSQSCSSDTGSGGVPSSGNGTYAMTLRPTNISSVNQDLTVDSDQSGLQTLQTVAGNISLAIPVGTVQTRTTFSVTPEPVTSMNSHWITVGTELVNRVFYLVIARDQNGNPVSSFLNPVTMTLPIPLDLQQFYGLALYWLNETNQAWVLMPEAMFQNGSVTFQMTQPARFAIFATKIGTQPGTLLPPVPQPVPPTTLPAPIMKKPTPPIVKLPAVVPDIVSRKSLIENVRDFFTSTIEWLWQSMDRIPKTPEVVSPTSTVNVGIVTTGTTSTVPITQSTAVGRLSWVWTIGFVALVGMLLKIMFIRKKY